MKVITIIIGMLLWGLEVFATLPTGANKTVTTAEDVNYLFVLSDFSFSDVDGHTFAQIRIVALPASGTLKHNGINCVAGTVYTDASLLSFVPAPDGNGSPYTTFTFRVIDSNAEQSAATYTITINVTAVADNPVAANASVSLSENSTYTFTAANFTGSYSDADGNAFAGIRITTVEGAGDLDYSGADVTAATDYANVTLLTFTPAANANGSPYTTFVYQVKDASGAYSTATYVMTINVTAVDYNPTGGNNTVSTNEDINITFASGNFPFADTDGHAFSGIQVTSVETNGDLEYNGVDVVTNQDCPNVALLVFKPDLNENGSPYATFTFKVKDASGAYSTANYTMTINVTAIDDAPTGADKTVTLAENGNYVFTLSDFTFADVDGQAFNGVQIISIETFGDLEYNNVDVTASQVCPNVTLFDFTPVADANGSPYATFTFKVRDAGGTYSTATYTMTINVTAVDYNPTGADFAKTNNEDVNYTFAVGDFTFADADGHTFSGIRIITTETAGDLEYSGVDVAVNTDCPNVGLLVFKPIANANGSPYATFTFKVKDSSGALSTATYTCTMNVTAVNDVPTAVNGSVTITEDVNYTFQNSDFPFTDVDGTIGGIRIMGVETGGDLEYNAVDVVANQICNIPLTNLVFKPTANSTTAVTFTFRVRDNLGSQSTTTRTMTINITPVADNPVGADISVSTNEDVNYTFAAATFTAGYSDGDGQAFSGIRITSVETSGDLEYNGTDVATNDLCPNVTLLVFKPDANTNGSPYATFTFKVVDSSGAESDLTYTATINVTSVLDNPIGANASVSTNEDVNYTFQLVDFTFSDDDGDAFSGIRIITVETAGDLEYSGVDVVANTDYATVTNLVFKPATNGNGTPYATFTFKVKDASGAYSTATYTASVNIAAIADNPLGADVSVTTSEDVNYTFTTLVFTTGFSDGDGNTFSGIRITSVETNGDLEYNGTDVATNDLCPNVTLLVFKPNANANGSPYATFTFKVVDSSGAESDLTYTATINVTSVADNPVGANATVSTNEDVNYTFQVSDFTYSDDDGQAFNGIRIIAVESAGDLEYSGVDVVANTDYATVTNLVFKPAANANGAPYATFTFRVKDASGAYSTATYTATINVVLVNDPPTGANASITGSEDVPYAFAVGNFTFSDPDGHLFSGIRVISTETDGDLTYSGVAVNAGQACADVTQLSFTSSANENGVGYATFTFKVLDSSGEESAATYTMTININAVNDQPTFTSTPGLDCAEGNVYTYNIFATDIDNPGTSLVFAGVTLPAWLTLTDNGDGSAVLTGTAPDNVLRVTDVVISVTDNLSVAVTQAYQILSSFAIKVPADYATIQLAINAAQTGDTVLVFPGTYTENIDFGGKSIVVGSQFMVTGDESYKNNTIIDGNSAGSAVKFISGETNSTKLIGLTITNGTGTYIDLRAFGKQHTVGYYGGGVFCWESSPSLIDVIIYNNYAPKAGNNGGAGGGIYLGNNSNAKLDSVRIVNNTAVLYRGGGICIDNSSPTLTDVLINSNAGGNYGGGMSLWNSNPTLNNVVITNNSVSGANGSGGGLFMLNSTPVISGGNISGNSATKNGNNSFTFN